MNSQDTAAPANAEASAGKKPWVTPEVRDQTVKSLTEAKIGAPHESNPTTGLS